MSLKALAASDLLSILGGRSGEDIKLTSPDGVTETFQGFSNDISQAIDPETGAIISGRAASVALLISDLNAKNFSLPKHIPSENEKPWLIEFESATGEVILFKVVQSNPDRTIGVITLILELYSDTGIN